MPDPKPRPGSIPGSTSIPTVPATFADALAVVRAAHVLALAGAHNLQLDDREAMRCASIALDLARVLTDYGQEDGR